MRAVTSWFNSSSSGTSPAAERVTALLGRPAVTGLINGLAVLLFAAWLAQLTWRVAAPGASNAPVELRENTEKAAFNLSVLQSAHLFGRPPDQSPALEDLPVSSLNVVVYGIVATARGGIALISSESGLVEPVGQGQEIRGGVVLDAVLADRIVIRRGAVKEYVLLETPSAANNVGTAPGRGSAVNTIDVDRHLRPLGENRYSITRELIQAQMRSPAAWRNAALVPQPGGGFLVREIVPGSLYEKLGLRVGDVITAVNGEPINAVEDALNLYQNIGQLNEVQLELRRGNETRQLSYIIQ